MADIDDFVEYLVDVSIGDGDTTYVDDLLAKARESIKEGNGTMSSLTGSSVNGKSFNRAIHYTALDVARACQKALRIYNDEDDSHSATYADFRGLRR